MTKANQDNIQSKLLDIVGDKLDAKNDAHLSRLLETQPPLLSKLRSHARVLGPTMIIRIHELTGMSVRDIKEFVGLKCMASMRQIPK